MQCNHGGADTLQVLWWITRQEVERAILGQRAQALTCPCILVILHEGGSILESSQGAYVTFVFTWTYSSIDICSMLLVAWSISEYLFLRNMSHSVAVIIDPTPHPTPMIWQTPISQWGVVRTCCSWGCVLRPSCKQLDKMSLKINYHNFISLSLFIHFNLFTAVYCQVTIIIVQT